MFFSYYKLSKKNSNLDYKRKTIVIKFDFIYDHFKIIILIEIILFESS